MKFTVNQSELSKALDRVIKFVPTRPVMPILANVLLVVDEKLTLTGSDLNNGIQLIVPGAEVIETGKICVPARSLAAIVKALKGQLVFEVNEMLCAIADLSGRVQIQCQEADEYPDLVQEPEVDLVECEINAQIFAKAVTLGGSCVSTDETKQVLTGVNITARNGLLTAVSTDGHRLTLYRAAINKAVTIPSATLPFKPLIAITDEGQVKLRFAEGHCEITMADAVLICRSLAGNYPDYSLLIPQAFDRMVTVDRSQLIEALSLMAAVNNQQSVVKLEIKSAKIIISSESESLKGDRSVPCDLIGDELTIAFNLKYMFGPLKIIPAKQVKISINGPLQPVIIQPADNEIDFLCLVMPVQIRN